MNTAQSQTIKSIADQAGSRREFLEKFLQHTFDEHGAVGGMFWDCTSNDPKPIAQNYCRDLDRLQLGCSARQHRELLLNAVRSKDPFVVSASESGESDNGPSILLVGVEQIDRNEVVELFFAAHHSREEVTAKGKSLAPLCQAASNYGTPGNPVPNPASSGCKVAAASLDAAVMDLFIHSLHQSLDLKDSSRIIANETRRFLDCDRVSVLRTKGKRNETLSVSGQPSVNRRSNLIRSMESVVNTIVPTRQVFWYPGEEDIPPQINEPLQEYLADTATRTFVVVPIFDRIDADRTNPEETQEPKRLVGAMVIEHCRQQWNRDQVGSRVEIATRHSSDAFRNAWQHQSLFLHGLWKWIGKSKVLYSARQLPKTVSALATMIALGMVLTFVQTDLELTCDGIVLPQNRQLVFPGRPGIVSEVFVEHGAKVQQGDPVARITDLDLDFQIAESEGRIKELQQSIRSAESSRLNNRRGDEDKLQQENLNAKRAELESLGEQLGILRSRRKTLVATSPLTGQVMTWDVRKRLQDRPIQRSEQLMEIADVEGPWELELHLPDRKIGHFLRHWAEANNKGEAVQVEFMLASAPGKSHLGTVRQVGKTTELNADNEQHLKVLVNINSDSLDLRQSRSGVSGKIQCGKSSLGYAWLYPVKEFFQSKVLFPVW